jgi:hypothetical protein
MNKTIDEIRRNRLLILIDAVGTQARLAALLGMTPGQLGQWKNASIDHKSQKPRAISSPSARAIERRFMLPPGWMDQPIGRREAPITLTIVETGEVIAVPAIEGEDEVSNAVNGVEGEMLIQMRRLSAEQQRNVLEMVRGLAASNSGNSESAA